MYFADYFSIVYSRIPAEELPKQLASDLSRRGNGAQQGLTILTSQLVRRLRKDNVAREALVKAMESSHDANSKASVPKLLASSGGVSPELASWCQEEIERQTSNDFVPEFGFDMFTGQISAVAHSLLDVVQASR